MRAPTSHDVARLAGVSQPTVSRALRGDARVTDATRRRIEDAAAQLGYIASRRGRSLSTRRTGQVAVVVEELANSFYMEAIGEIHRALDGIGMRLVVFTDEAASLERLLDGSFDGAILTTTSLGSALPHRLAERGLPIVLFNRTVDSAPADSCVSANADGAGMAAQLLLEQGHSRVGALLGPADTSTSRERERGLRDVLAAGGRPLDEALVRRGPYAHRAGIEGLRSLWAAKRRPTAVFCANDVIAIGALNEAARLGVRVPGELTIVGFDDIAMAAWDVFELTTVRQDLGRMATTTAELLLDRIDVPSLAARERVVPTSLVLRASHGPRRAG
jgi:LacI family transcriptional regulator